MKHAVAQVAMENPVIKPSSLNPNKHLKEQFVSNLNGCSMFEIFVLTSMLSVAILICRCIGFHGTTGTILIIPHFACPCFLSASGIISRLEHLGLLFYTNDFKRLQDCFH